MAAKLFTLPRQTPLSNSGALMPGSKAHFYVNGTSTKQDTYTTSALSVANTNPIIADGNGLFGPIYLDGSLRYKVVITDADDVELYTEDNFTVPSTIVSDLASTDNGKGASTVGVEDDAGNLTATDVEAALAEIFTSLADPTKVMLYGGTAQELEGAGAVDVTSGITHLVTTGADALTLADGTEGQRKFIVMKTDGGDGTLTPSNLGNGTTITFDDVGDSADLLFTNAAWHFMGGTATLA